MTETESSKAQSAGLAETDRAELRAALRDYLSSEADTQHLRAHMATDDGYDASLWKRLAVDLGVQGLALPEWAGGAGYGLGELQLIQEELGRALYSGPYFSTVALGARLLEYSPMTVQEQILPGVADGTTTLALAVREGPNGSWHRSPDAVAELRGSEWRISGTKTYVINALGCDVLLVLAHASGAPCLFSVAREAAEIVPVPALDQTRALGTVILRDAPAQLILGVDGPLNAAHALTNVLTEAGLLLGAEQVGAAGRVLEFTVEYTKERYQFGRAIGSFQAVKHHAANMLLSLELARATVSGAVRQLADGAAHDDPLCDAAAVLATQAFVEVCETAIQLHGGMGVTWEHDVHLFLKRAKADELLLETPVVRRARIARLLEL